MILKKKKSNKKRKENIAICAILHVECLMLRKHGRCAQLWRWV